MMTEREREVLTAAAAQHAAAALARGDDLRSSLAPFFHAAIRQHPDEEDRLLELWDRLTSRQIV